LVEETWSSRVEIMLKHIEIYRVRIAIVIDQMQEVVAVMGESEKGKDFISGIRDFAIESQLEESPERAVPFSIWSNNRNDESEPRLLETQRVSADCSTEGMRNIGE
jgi:hypothetical protein